MKTNKPILGIMITAVAVPSLALAGNRDDFPRDAVICKAKEAIEIAEDMNHEFENFLHNRRSCEPNHYERALLTGLKELERRAGHVVKAAVTGCMPTTVERRSDYLRTVVERTDTLARRVGVRNLPCDIPGELELINELACEISALTRTRGSHRDSHDGHDHARTNDCDRDFRVDERNSHDRREVNSRNILPAVTDLRFGGRNWEIRIQR